MRSRLFPRFFPVLAMTLLVASVAWSAQVVSSTARGVPAVMQAGGFMLQPVGTAPASYNDLAPQQLFEIVRPGNQPVTIGRMFTSCTCVRLEADSRSFRPGERAVVRMRNVQATPPGGQSYALYVQITSPIQTTLRYDTYVQSSQFVPAAEGLQPTRGNIVSDGVLADPVYSAITNSPDFKVSSTPSAAIYTGGDIELIVPKAENYQPDTSEYTLRKKAEEEAAKKSRDVSSTEKDTAKSGVPSGKATDRADAAAPALGEVADKARAEAETAARLTAEQSKTLREEAKKIGDDMLSGAKKAASESAKDAEKAVGAAAKATGEKASAAADKAEPLWKEVGPKAKAAERAAANAASSAGDAVKSAASAAGDAAKSAAASVAKGAAKVEDKAESAVKSAVSAASGAAAKVESAGKSAVDAAAKGAAAVEDKAASAVKSAASAASNAAAKVESAGKSAVDAAAKGAAAVEDKAASAVKSAASAASDAAAKAERSGEAAVDAVKKAVKE